MPQIVHDGPAMRASLREAIVGFLASGSWNQIEATFMRVELDWRPDLEPGWGKPSYCEKVLEPLSMDELVGLAERCIDGSAPEEVGSIQDALWWMESEGVATLTRVTRIALAEAMDGSRIHPREPPDAWLDRFAPAGSIGHSGWTRPHRYFYATDGSLRRSTQSIVFGFDGTAAADSSRATHRDLLESAGFMDWPDKRVFRLLEALVHPEVRTGADQQRWLDLLEPCLVPDSLELVVASTISGHPEYAVRPIDAGVSGRPKNLIFASKGPKPEIGFRDAVNNDIVVLRNAEHCLVFEEPIPDDGLSWEVLVDWWRRSQGGVADGCEARSSLGERLKLCFPDSIPEYNLFASYFRVFKPRLASSLPALLPQVYLHYDPRTVRQLHARGESKRFVAQRMDFLLLLKNRVRVVLEVDGKQHYAENGVPSPKMYAATMQADRRLRLAGYEVYRFGGYELFRQPQATTTVEAFFSKLFERHRVVP